MIRSLATTLTLTLMTGCAHQQPLIVTGSALVGLADQFVATAEVMDNALENKAITPDTYKQWVVFGKKFQRAYPLVVALWQAASTSDDAKLVANVITLANELALELWDWNREVK